MMISIFRLATNSTLYRLPALASFMVLVVLGGSASAQDRPNYGRTYSKAEVERLIKDVEQSGNDFRRDFDRWLDRSALDGQQREDRYNKQVKNLANSLSTLRTNFDRNNDWWMSRNDLQRVLRDAKPVNSMMSNREVGGSLDRQWAKLRRNLDRLAEAFNLPRVGSAFFGNQPTGYPTQGGVAPNWAIGTFRGRTNNGEAELTIGADGTATARSLVSNAQFMGRVANTVLYFDYGSFNLVRDGRGFSTVEIGNELNRTSYTRVSGYQAGNNPVYPEPGSGYPPDWAVGTFRGRTDSGESELTIAANGAATARALSTNAVYNGQYANGVLTFPWGTYNLVRESRGISTVEVGNQQSRTRYTRVQ